MKNALIAALVAGLISTGTASATDDTAPVTFGDIKAYTEWQANRDASQEATTEALIVRVDRLESNVRQLKNRVRFLRVKVRMLNHAR